MIPQIFTRARGPLAASAHEVGTAQVRVLIGCVFSEIVIESETCHICVRNRTLTLIEREDDSRSWGYILIGC
jgi:hypothetical protein